MGVGVGVEMEHGSKESLFLRDSGVGCLAFPFGPISMDTLCLPHSAFISRQ